MRRQIVAAAVIAVGLGGAFIWAILHRGKSPEPTLATTLQLPTNPAELDGFVKTRGKSKDPVMQDLVSAARIRLGYQSAHQHDWAQARKVFQTAATRKGTELMSPEWGTLDDQAAYQAAVCLVATGKARQARSEFVQFIKERPLSPLVHASYQRLVRLNGGQPLPEDTRLLEGAIAKQEAHIRFETSVCGPKTLEFLLTKKLVTHHGTGPLDYKQLAGLCHTTDRGTTVEGMCHGIRSIGLTPYAYRLNRVDLTKAPLPAIALNGDHYVAVLVVGAKNLVLFDPQLGSEIKLDLPPLDDPDFVLNTILFAPLPRTL